MLVFGFELNSLLVWMWIWENLEVEFDCLLIVLGWSGNPVCAKRYHFIIKADGQSIGAYNKPCSSCGDSFQGSDSR